MHDKTVTSCGCSAKDMIQVQAHQSSPRCSAQRKHLKNRIDGEKLYSILMRCVAEVTARRDCSRDAITSSATVRPEGPPQNPKPNWELWQHAVKTKKTTKLDAAGSVDKHGGEIESKLARVDRGDRSPQSTR